MTHHNTGQEATVPAIKLTIEETKRWKTAAEKPLLELELLRRGSLPGALVRDHKSSVLGRLTGGAVSSLPQVPGGIQQPHQRAGAPTQVPQPAQRHAPPALPVAQASATPPPVQWTQHAPPVVAPPPPAPAPVPLQPPGPIARRAAAAVAEELRQLRALDAEARAIGAALGVGGTGAEILAALRIRLVEQDKELAELEALTLALCDAENVVEEAEKEDTAAAAADVVIPIVEPALDGDG